jgi:phage/plasmid-like protein (TIGR03299 family)
VEDPGGILGIFKQGYVAHQYKTWLLETVSNILDDDLSIGSAGLLRMGGQAWVSVEVPDNIVTSSGFAFRPNLVAATSLDGSLATIFKPVVQAIVCDNTLSMGLREDSPQFKVRHSRYSHAKLQDVREALDIVHQIGDTFSQQVEELTNTTVTDAQWSKFLDTLTPTTQPDGTMKTGRSLSMASNKRDRLINLYDNDLRVQPWRGTAFGVVQAVNTYEHHVVGATRSASQRADMNMSRVVTGGVDKLDRDTYAMISRVLNPA